MKNLFILHTQYTIGLAAGLCQKRFKSEFNELIIFSDFRSVQNLIENLNHVFQKIQVFPGIIDIKNKTWKMKVQQYPSEIKWIINEIQTQKFDRLFLVCDGNIPELYALKYCHKENKDVEISWIEDGALPYFKNVDVHSGLDTNKVTRFFRKVVLKYIFGLGKYYAFCSDTMGGNRWIKKYYLTYPNCVREEYSLRSACTITGAEFYEGLRIMYGEKRNIKLELPKSSILFMIDKIDTYKNAKEVGLALKDFAKKMKIQNDHVFYKYHPRENQKLNDLSEYVELPRDIGAEKIYIQNIGKDIKVLGIKSTGLQTAKKMGYDVYSIANLVDEANEKLDAFYQKIGICVIK